MHLILLLLLREVDAFEGEIDSAVEDAISNKIREGIIKLESFNHFKYTSQYTALLF